VELQLLYLCPFAVKEGEKPISCVVVVGDVEVGESGSATCGQEDHALILEAVSD
jgi:hypothetical protein